MSNREFRQTMTVCWTVITGLFLGMAGFRFIEFLKGHETAGSLFLPFMWVLIGLLNLYTNRKVARREAAKEKERTS